MSETPRRKRLQIHLSTAVVMMFVAGALVWANVRPQKYDGSDSAKIRGQLDPDMLPEGFTNDWETTATIRRIYGWPAIAYRDYNLDKFFHASTRDRIKAKGLVTNILVAAFILTGVWFISESIIRRRAARKGT